MDHPVTCSLFFPLLHSVDSLSENRPSRLFLAALVGDIPLEDTKTAEPRWLIRRSSSVVDLSPEHVELRRSRIIDIYVTAGLL